MKLVFYAFAALAVAVLFARHLKKVRAARQSDDPIPPTEPSASESPLTGSPMAARPVTAATVSTEPASWESRRLFEGDRRRGTDELLPLEPGDAPTAGTEDYAFGAATPVLASLLPESAERRQLIKRELLAAGYHQPHAYLNLAALRYLAVVVPLVLILLALVFLPQTLEPAAVGLLLFVPALGWLTPRLVVQGQARERLGRIEHAMPDMLDMLNMCVSQGMTVQAALRRVSRELRSVYPELADELRIVVEQAELGSLEQALENFSRRIDLPEVHSFTTLLIQTERMGTSVSAALTDYSDNMRESLKQRADEKANTATFKLLFPTVLCLMPAVFLFLLGPAVIELGDFFTGTGRELLDVNPSDFNQFNEGE
jgi:tight adherence protein C